MAETPARKRPVSASRPAPAKRAAAAASVASKRPSARRARPTAFVEDEAPTTNYAVRLTEGLGDDSPPISARPTRGLRPPSAKVAEPVDDSFALRLSQALEAISAAQADESTVHAAPSSVKTVKSNWLASLDKLPPIRLPIGPAIPWKIGLPLFVAVVVLMGFMSRSAAHMDPPGVQLPAQQTYPVQQDSPLFAKPQPTDAPAPDAAAPQPQAQPQLGVQDPGGLGFDMVDMGIKLVAVLALAYGSLMVLKKFGVGGASSARGGTASAVRVISSLALAPNRSVHVVEVAGGKTLLIGATPNSVNLLADLSEPSPEK